MPDKKIQLTEEYAKGKDVMKNSFVSICSIVRDCEKNLKRNIPRIEYLRGFFKKSEVIIFENDSKDNTLKILKDWKELSSGIHIYHENYNVATIPSQKEGEANPFFSIPRIEKMVFYRNKYLEYLNKGDCDRDFVIVIDLDISNFEVDGIVHSFGLPEKWDCISANGISRAPNFKNQYHDSYALIEKGKINDIQTEKIIIDNRAHYSGLKVGMPLVSVDSAYGGLAIYRWNSIMNLYYACPLNDDPMVQCKSEHVGLHLGMKNNGHSGIFINPSMMVKYRSVTLRFLFTKLRERLLKS